MSAIRDKTVMEPEMTLRVVELYSGIGGMHWALIESGLKYEVVAAVDINNTANLVYTANFPTVRVISKCLLTLKTEDFEEFMMDALLMSPPCQPFTTVGKQRDVQDDRTKSFLHILNILQQMKRPPRYILVENVRGFEKSQARDKLVETLNCLNYRVEEVLCCPSQFGIPNSRLRYFLMASRELANRLGQFRSGQTDPVSRNKCFISSESTHDSSAESAVMASSEKFAHVESKLQILTDCDLSDATKYRNCSKISRSVADESAESEASTHSLSCESSNLCGGTSSSSVSCHGSHSSFAVEGSSSREDMLESSHAELALNSGHSVTTVELKISESILGLTKNRRKLYDFFESHPNDSDYWQKFILPKKFYRQFWVTDLVKSDSEGSCCFTKRYGHYIEGAGSIIQMGCDGRDLMKFKGQENCEEFQEEMKRLGLRFFSPREIANLLCFPQEFVMPTEVTVKQWFRLLGNSLNVSVVSFLLQHLTGSNAVR